MNQAEHPSPPTIPMEKEKDMYQPSEQKHICALQGQLMVPRLSMLEISQ